MQVQTFRKISEQLRPEKPLKATKKNIEIARKEFLAIWVEHLEYYYGIYAPEKLPKALSGGCVYGAVVSRIIFGGEIQGNWHHLWTELDGKIIDLTGLLHVSKKTAIQAHLEMLHSKEYIIEPKKDGTYFIKISHCDGTYSNKITFNPETLFKNTPRIKNDFEFRKNLQSVLPRATKWAKQIQTEIEYCNDQKNITK